MSSRRDVYNRIFVAAIPIAFYLVFVILRPDAFGSPTTIYNVFQQSIITAIIGWGLSFTIEMGEIDLAVGAEIVLAAIVGALLGSVMGLPGIIAGCLVSAAVSGALKAAAARYLGIPTMILTIALTYLFAAAGGILTQSKSVVISADDAILGRAPWNIVIFVIAGTVVYALHSPGIYGAHVRAVANAPGLAGRNGIDPRSVRTRALLISSLFAGVGAILKLSHGSSAAPTDGASSILTILEPIMCVFIAMMLVRYVSLTIGIFVGALVMSVIGNGLVAVSMPPSYNNVVIGAILIGLMGLIGWRSLRGAKLTRLRKMRSREESRNAPAAVVG